MNFNKFYLHPTPTRYFPMENPALRNGHTEDESRALHMGVCFTRFSQVNSFQVKHIQ